MARVCDDLKPGGTIHRFVGHLFILANVNFAEIVQTGAKTLANGCDLVANYLLCSHLTHQSRHLRREFRFQAIVEPVVGDRSDRCTRSKRSADSESFDVKDAFDWGSNDVLWGIHDPFKARVAKGLKVQEEKSGYEERQKDHEPHRLPHQAPRRARPQRRTPPLAKFRGMERVE